MTSLNYVGFPSSHRKVSHTHYYSEVSCSRRLLPVSIQLEGVLYPAYEWDERLVWGSDRQSIHVQAVAHLVGLGKEKHGELGLDSREFSLGSKQTFILKSNIMITCQNNRFWWRYLWPGSCAAAPAVPAVTFISSTYSIQTVHYKVESSRKSNFRSSSSFGPPSVNTLTEGPRAQQSLYLCNRSSISGLFEAGLYKVVCLYVSFDRKSAGN